MVEWGSWELGIRIESVNDTLRGFIDRPEALRNRLADLDTALLEIQIKAEEASNKAGVGAKMRQESRAKVEEIKQLRNIIGFPQRAKNRSEVEALSSGTLFYYEPTKTFQVRGERK